jgi:hypothetical protein
MPTPNEQWIDTLESELRSLGADTDLLNDYHIAIIASERQAVAAQGSGIRGLLTEAYEMLIVSPEPESGKDRALKSEWIRTYRRYRYARAAILDGQSASASVNYSPGYEACPICGNSHRSSACPPPAILGGQSAIPKETFWHGGNPKTDGLYFVALECKRPPKEWYETGYWEREHWDLPEVSKGSKVVAWAEIPPMDAASEPATPLQEARDRGVE